MAPPTTAVSARDVARLPAIPADLPILYEDDEEGEMGESNLHVTAAEILHVCIQAHLAKQSEYRVYTNMNFYYPGPPSPAGSPSPYVSPDLMVVKPFEPLGEDVTSYFWREDGPAPVLVAEVLSERSAQQRDLEEKVILYAKLGVAEYLLVDTRARFLPEKLLLKRLQARQTWKNEQDADGGLTSRLGFRLIIDTDGRLCVLDAVTGKRYIRPDEAQAEAHARRHAEERIRTLEAELERLRGKAPEPKAKKKAGKRRKKT